MKTIVSVQLVRLVDDRDWGAGSARQEIRIDDVETPSGQRAVVSGKAAELAQQAWDELCSRQR